jgi:hypothetical protein
LELHWELLVFSLGAELGVAQGTLLGIALACWFTAGYSTSCLGWSLESRDLGIELGSALSKNFAWSSVPHSARYLACWSWV